MERALQNRVEVAGSWVTVNRYGAAEGPTAVILPGVMSDAAAWAEVACALRSSRTPAVAVVNRRGRRPSGPLGGEYSLATEVDDLLSVLEVVRVTGDVRALIGWSYGGLIALRAADRVAVPHLVAYEPVMRPFGLEALPTLRAAAAAGDLDAIIEAVITQISRMPRASLEALRSNPRAWAALRGLAEPVAAETAALNVDLPARIGTGATRVDLVVGGRSRGAAPYGTTFENVRRRVPAARVHVLPGQGHMAHLEDPAALAGLIQQVLAQGRG